MTDPLPIQPFTRPLNGQPVDLPGSKSITNRAIILATLGNRPVTLTNALFSRDTRIMISALRELGLAIEADEAARTILVPGCEGHLPVREAALDVGNAGTAARFLTALLAAQPAATYHLDGDPAMRKRPMIGLLEALEKQGTRITCHETNGFFPFTLKTNGLAGGKLTVDASASSQILSALLMVAPLAHAPLALKLAGSTVSRPFVRMTLRMMEHFGLPAPAPETEDTFTFPAYQQSKPPSLAIYPVDPDATAASYFQILPLVTGGHLRLPTYPHPELQGDAAFGILADKLIAAPQGETHDFNAISDTFLTLAAVAPLLSGPTTITGIHHTRFQETDRIRAIATELERLGQKVEPSAAQLIDDRNLGELTIHPRPLQPATVQTYEDHRMAMSFAILGCHDLRGNGSSWLKIGDPGCCAKTFPHFFDVLNRLYQDVHV